MKEEEYKTIKSKELNLTGSDWDFAAHMQNVAKNSEWKNKYGLWTILSGACNEAAAKYYSKIVNFARNIIDIDTCEIHELKSLAEESDLGFLTKNIKEEYPEEILNLINLFSVNKNYLLGKMDFLSLESNEFLFGEITKRAAEIAANEYSLKSNGVNEVISNSIVHDIIDHVEDIKVILNLNMIYVRFPLERYLKSDLYYLKVSDRSDEEVDEILNYNVEDILDAIKCIKNIKKKNADSIDFDIFSTMKLKVDFVEESNKILAKGINPFYLLINIIRQNFYNERANAVIVPMYYDKERNYQVNLIPLFANIVNVISQDNELYIKWFICFHFYNLIRSKICNKNLQSLFKYDETSCEFICKEDRYKAFEYDEDGNQIDKKTEFTTVISDWINDVDLENLLNPVNTNGTQLNIMNVVNDYVKEFAQYIGFVNEARKEMEGLGIEDIPFNVLLFNYPEFYRKNMTRAYNAHNSVLYDTLRSFINSYEHTLSTKTFEEESFDGYVMNLAKWLTDLCINISMIREQIKASILQYELVGTRRIATDILTDFFLKNFSNQKDWGYISDTNLSSLHLMKPMSALLGLSGNSRFTIDVVEYYDRGNYLNIESDLGNALVGQYLSRVDVTPEYYIDGNNLVASALVSTNIYEDLYVPCATFIRDYNSKFWEVSTDVIGDKDQSVIDTRFIDEDSFLKFYDQVDSFSINEVKYESNEERRTRIENLLNKAWEEFALSGFSESDLTQLSILRKRYIGNDNGDFKYKNLTNKYFPTIAIAPNIKNLYPVSEISEMNIMVLAKAYYSLLEESMEKASVDMFKMNDENGVPTDGWRQKYANFHGYSSAYESASNINQNSEEGTVSKYSDVDGPWSYSALQSALFKRYDGDFSFLSSLMYDGATENSGVLDMYSELIESGWLETEMFDKVIAANEIDSNNTSFTLLKSRQDDIYGKLYIRTQSMLICLPLEKMLILKEYPEAVHVMNNCIKFGVVDDVIWMFGRDNLGSLKFYVVKYAFSSVARLTIKANEETSIDTIKLNSVNDFIGYDTTNENTINFFFFDSRNELQKLSAKKYDDLFDYSIGINLVEMDLSDLTHRIVEIKKSGTAFPAILKHSEDKSTIDFEEEHLIWKIEPYEDNTYICYEALNDNKSLSTEFDYYFSFGQKSVWIEAWKFDLELKDYHMYVNGSDKEVLYGNYASLNKTYEQIIVPSYDYENGTDDMIEALCKFFLKFPKCSIKNGMLSIEIVPPLFALELFNLEPNDLKKSVFWHICKNIYSFIKTTNDNLLNDNNYSTLVNKFKNNEELDDILRMMVDEYSYVYEYEGLHIDASVLTFENILKSKIKVFVDNGIVSPDAKEIMNGYRSEIEFFNGIKTMSSFICSFDEFENSASDEAEENELSFMQVIKGMPSLNRCIAEPIKIGINFKNDTGITLIHDYALDLDVSCYINDNVEKNHRVGYWAGFKETQYVKWYGDVTKGDLEYIEVNPYLYIKNHKKLDNPIEIVLNCCWNSNSEITLDHVYATISYMGVLQNIDLPVIGYNSKECNERSLVLYIDHKSGALSYEIPALYTAVKIWLKNKMKAYEDEVCDVCAGFVNLTKRDLNNILMIDKISSIDSSTLAVYSIDKSHELNYRYVELLFLDSAETVTDEASLKTLIEIKLNKLFKYSSLKFGSLDYQGLSLENIFFGYANYSHSYSNFGVLYNYFGYLNPKYFKEAMKNKLEFPILSAVEFEMKEKIKKFISE